jgi:hypothetical protein
MVYLSSSKFSLAVLGNMAFAIALGTYKVLLRVRQCALVCRLDSRDLLAALCVLLLCSLGLLHTCSRHPRKVGICCFNIQSIIQKQVTRRQCITFPHQRCVLVVAPACPQVFLGRLRDSEVERVNDKIGQAVVETCLAMTIFREDFTASFLTCARGLVVLDARAGRAFLLHS